MANAAASQILIPSMEIGRLTIKIIGTSPLICHRWTEKAKREMLWTQMMKAKKGKQPKDPIADFNGSRYIHPDGWDGIPVVAFKLAAVRAATDVKMKMTDARRAFHVTGEHDRDLARIEKDGKPVEPTMREDMVRVGMGTADIRYRPEYTEWETVIIVEYNKSVISDEQIVNLFKIAGFGVGICEWRPEKGGQFGRFTV